MGTIEKDDAFARVARHKKIIELIQEYAIDTQKDLAGRLLKAGFPVTQATVSRDIKALKLTKVTLKDGGSRYCLIEDPKAQSQIKYTRVLQDSVTSIAVGQNLVVIHTVPGMAMGAATALDCLSYRAILGCIAGDDTIFCACSSHEDAKAVAKRLEQVAGVKQ